ncbi:hypothetical protein BC937DRAFT_93346, partial [Endogone sp. FLAS-F59071]
MPAENKGMFEMKTSSYHISAVESCKQSKKVPTNFKLVVLRDRDQKSYDLEADTPKETGELAAGYDFADGMMLVRVLRNLHSDQPPDTDEQGDK